MDVNSIFLDCADRISLEMNGSLVYSKFNRYSKLAELRTLNFITGNLAGQPGYPEPYTTQKDKDFVFPFIETELVLVQDGTCDVPALYYMWERAAVIGTRKDELCGQPVIIEGCDTPIELLDSAVFDARCNTYIESLKPSLKKPICKLVGKKIHFMPKDLAGVAIEFKRYPKVYAELVTMVDPVFNNEVVDVANSIPYEWDEGFREYIVFFIVQFFGGGTRERALQEQNNLINKAATP